jgi:hypothetical protein
VGHRHVMLAAEFDSKSSLLLSVSSTVENTLLI